VTRLALNELRRASRLGLVRPERHDRLCEQFKRRLARLEEREDMTWTGKLTNWR
jgi:hypothetical protein